MRIDIRKAEEADVEALAFVVNATWQTRYVDILTVADIAKYSSAQRREEDFRRRIESGTVFALSVDGEICGVCSAEKSAVPDVCEIVQLYILPQNQGHGLGRKLLSHTLREMRRLGYKEARLWVMDRNEAAKGFYRKIGFEPSGKRELISGFEAEVFASEYETAL